MSRPTGRINSVTRDVAASTSLPTEAQLRQLATALDQLKAALPAAKDLEGTLVPAFNRKLDDLGVPATVPRLKT